MDYRKDAKVLSIALALAIIRAKKKKSALVALAPVDRQELECNKCYELQDAINRLQNELDFLKKQHNTDINSLVANVHLSEAEIRQTEVWQFFTKADHMQRKLSSCNLLGQPAEMDKELDLVVSECEAHIGKIYNKHWQPDALFDSCIRFLISASQPEVFTLQKEILLSRTKNLVAMMLQEIISFSLDSGKHPQQRDHASRAIVELSKCNGTESILVEIVFGKILEFIKETNAVRQMYSYQTLENLFFYCWILESVVKSSAGNAKVWPNIISTLELLSQNTNQATNLPPLLERYIYKIIMNVPNPTNQERQVDKLQQAQLGHLLSKIESQLTAKNTQ